MLKVSKPAAHRVEIEVSGVLDADAMQEAVAQLVEASQGVSKGRMLYRIADFAMPTMGAFAIELRNLPKLFEIVGRFEKCAVLCDTAWIRTAAEIEGVVIPSLEVRGFALSEEDAANAWLGESTAPSDSEAEQENFPV